METQKLCQETSTKELISLSLGHQNLIRSFIEYFEYRTYDNYPIGDDWTRITNKDFNDSRMKYYYKFRSLHEAVLVNPRPALTTSSYTRHYPVDNLKRPIKYNPDPPIFDTVKLLCNETKLIKSFTTNNKFISPTHDIMINKDQERKEGLERSRVFPSDEPNPMYYHRNMLLSSD